MSEPGESDRRRGRGRVHNAKGAQEAILNAAEEIFAEHGFDGARIDAIAAKSGYNKSLLFQYFDDKLNLYAEVLKRADRELNVMQAHVLAPLLEDEAIVLDANTFKSLLESIATALFDYLLEHPRLMRMILWEMAEGWQTYVKIFPQINTDDLSLFEKLFRKAYNTGLLRTNFVPAIQLTMFLQICQSYLAYLPLYRIILPGEDLSSPAALEQARQYIVTLVVSGMIKDSPEPKP